MNRLKSEPKSHWENQKIPYIFIVASAVSALLLNSCSHSFDEAWIPNRTIVYNPLPYRPLSELWKDVVYSVPWEECETWSQLQLLMTQSSPSSAEEYVDDSGNIFTREELESGNQ